MINRIKKNTSLPFVKNTLKLSASSVILMLLPLIVTPMLSRLYTPSEYGDWGLMSSVLAIINSFLFLSYENAIVKTNNNKEVPILVLVCFTISLIIILITTLIFNIGKIANNSFFSDFPSISLLILSLFFYSIYAISNSVANRQNQYGKMSVASISNAIFQAGFRVLFGVFPIVSYGLIAGNLLAQIISALILFFGIKCFLFELFKEPIERSTIKNIIVKYKNFPLYDAPSRFIEFAIGNLPLIILSFFWAKDTLGCYSMVVQFILMPIAIIGSAMASVLYRDISENIDDKSKVLISVRRVAKIAFYVSVVPMLFLALGGDKLLVLLLGNQWTSAGKMAIIMSLYSAPVILSEPLLPIFKALSMQKLRLRLDILCFLFSIGFLVCSAYLFNSMYITLLFYSLAYGGVRLVMFHKLINIVRLEERQISGYFTIVLLLSYVVVATRVLLLVSQ